jgi:hypothetical protein
MTIPKVNGSGMMSEYSVLKHLQERVCDASHGMEIFMERKLHLGFQSPSLSLPNGL